MAADQDGAVRGAREREPLVAGRIHRLQSPAPGHAVPQPPARLLPGLRPGDALRAVLVTGQLLELAELLHDTAKFEWHAATLTFPAGSVVSIA